MSKEYILTACKPYSNNVNAFECDNPKWKQITLTEEDMGIIIYSLFFREMKGLPDIGSSLLLDKLNMFVGDKPLDLRDCKAQIDPEYKARHDE